MVANSVGQTGIKPGRSTFQKRVRGFRIIPRHRICGARGSGVFCVKGMPGVRVCLVVCRRTPESGRGTRQEFDMWICHHRCLLDLVTFVLQTEKSSHHPHVSCQLTDSEACTPFQRWLPGLHNRNNEQKERLALKGVCGK